MALITQFAQPGMYAAQGLAGIRENRLAMAAQEAERATERAQQDAIRNILGVSGQAPRGIDTPAVDPAMAAAEAAGVPGVGLGPAPAGGGGGGVQSPAQQPPQPQAPRLPYSPQQIQDMTLVDRQIASEMRQQNTAAATEVNRRETHVNQVLNSAAERVLASDNPDAQSPLTARAVAEELNISVQEAQSRLDNQMQIASAPRPTELQRIIRNAGVEQGSAQERQIYQGILQRRLESSGMRELAHGLAAMARGQEAIGNALGEQGFRKVVLDQLQLTQDTAANAASLLSLTEQFRSSIAAAGGENVAGIIGELRRAGTGLSGTLRQLSGLGESGQSVAEFVNQTVADAREGLDADTFERLFGNSNIAAVEVLGNAVNYANARMRHGVGPLSNQDIDRNAIVKGLLQSDAMLFSILAAVETEAYGQFQRAVDRNAAIQEDPRLALGIQPLPDSIQLRLSGQGGAAPAAQGDNEFSGMSDAELRRIAGGGD